MSEIILGVIIYILMYILVYILLEFNTTDKLKHKIVLFVTWPLFVMLFIIFVVYVGIKKFIIYVKRRF